MQTHRSYLSTVVNRHIRSMGVHVQRWVLEHKKTSLLTELSACVGRSVTGDEKLKAYLNLLGTIIKVQVRSL